MGGRGARFGISEKGNKYGSQYHALLESGNIKFVSKNARQSEDLMDTMTSGRIYATVGGDDIIRITFLTLQINVIKLSKRISDQVNGMSIKGIIMQNTVKRFTVTCRYLIASFLTKFRDYGKIDDRIGGRTEILQV